MIGQSMNLAQNELLNSKTSGKINALDMKSMTKKYFEIAKDLHETLQ